MGKHALTINGRRQVVEAPDDTPLLWVLRDTLGLTGAKYGCGAGVCGACTVLRDGEAVRSCQLALSDAAGQSFTTIEGLSPDGTHACQRAWIEEDVAQCGYCQAGMILTAAALLGRKTAPSEQEVEQTMSQLVCRCGTYQRIRKAIQRAAAEVRK